MAWVVLVSTASEDELCEDDKIHTLCNDVCCVKHTGYFDVSMQRINNILSMRSVQRGLVLNLSVSTPDIYLNIYLCLIAETSSAHYAANYFPLVNGDAGCP